MAYARAHANSSPPMANLEVHGGLARRVGRRRHLDPRPERRRQLAEEPLVASGAAVLHANPPAAFAACCCCCGHRLQVGRSGCSAPAGVYKLPPAAARATLLMQGGTSWSTAGWCAAHQARLSLYIPLLMTGSLHVDHHRSVPYVAWVRAPQPAPAGWDRRLPHARMRARA
jgi:hypothetical protein